MEQLRAGWRRATWENVGPTINFGTATGLSGAILGSLWATYRSYPRIRIYALLSFLQYSTYGFLFHGSRGIYLANPNLRLLPSFSKHESPTDASPTPTTSSTSTRSNSPTRCELLTASALGGATSGALFNAIFRQRFIISGALQLALYGYIGQGAFLWLDERHLRKAAREVERRRKIAAGEEEGGGGYGGRKPTIMERTATYMGMRKMSDEEYVGVLREKALALEAEIELMDEKIGELRREEGERERERVEGFVSNDVGRKVEEEAKR